MTHKKFVTRAITGLVGAIAASLAGAQSPPAEEPASPAASVGLFVYPAKGQDAAQQSKDETECYDSSKSKTGFDPAAPAPAAAPAAEPEKQGAGGERIRGAARGAAAGAVIGEVADDDASRGAEVGAAAGVIAGGRQARQNRRAEEQQAAEATKANEQAAMEAQEERVDTFKRAMSACLEARGYTTK
jgi:hypothetical protein